MPVFSSTKTLEIAHSILLAAKVPEEEVHIVASELRDANLVGHDSHGVMRLMQYVDYVGKGIIRPGREIRVVQDAPTFCVLDANFNFGQVAASRAVDLGLSKAHESGTATLVIRNCNHVGRLGSYAQRAALDGFACMMAVNAPGPGAVAPFGGMDRRLGTNPIAMAAPRDTEPLVLDMTTSASAEGKLRVAFQKGEHVPEGWIIDAHGTPSTDPAVFYADPPGALLPLGGPLGFKGFGMSVLIDVFGGILSGSGVCRSDLAPGANGVWMYFLAIERFIPRTEYDELMNRYVEHVRSSRRLPGVTEILLPGEIEMRRRAERLSSGVLIPDETWRQLTALAERLGAKIPRPD